VAPARPSGRDGLSGRHYIAHLLEQRLVVGVDGQVGFTVVHNQQIAKAPHPFCVHHLAAGNSSNWLPLGCANEESLCFRPRRPSWSAEPPGQFPASRQAKAAAQFREGLFSRLRRKEHRELFHEPRQAGRVRTQYLDFLATLADLARRLVEHPAPFAPLGEEFFTIGAALRLQRIEAYALRLRVPGETSGLGESRAVVGEHRGRGACKGGRIVEAARDGGGVLAGKRRAQRVGRAVRLLRGQHACNRLLALGKRTLESRAARRDGGRLPAHFLSLRPQLRERAIGRRNRTLGLAQAVARFLADLFFFVQAAGQRFDGAAKRRQIFFLACRDGVAAPEREEKADEREERNP